MEKILAIIFVTIFMIFCFFIMRYLFIKSILHFRLLKEIYPDKLINVNTLFKMMWVANILKLRLDIMIWFYFPIYYSKISLDDYGEDALKLHHKLIRNNKKIAIVFLLFLIYFAAFWFVVKNIGT